MFLYKFFYFLSAFAGNESIQDVDDPSTTGDINTSIGLCCEATGREDRRADVTESADVHRSVIRDLEVSKDRILVHLGHRTAGQCLLDVCLWA